MGSKVISEAKSVLILVGPPKGYLDDALQVGPRTPGCELHPAPDLRTDIPLRNVEPIYKFSLH
jgi:hypothetical protein